MIHWVSVENMRQSDAYTIAHLVPGRELIRRAAHSVFRGVEDWRGPTAIVAGSGNNGADGYALACILGEQGYDCALFTVGRAPTGDCGYFAEAAASAGIPIEPFVPGCLEGFAMVVDCLLGTGFRRPLRQAYAEAIDEINRSGAYVVSVDINSGMDGDTGEGDPVVRSDLTVTIGFVKRGTVTPQGGAYIRRMVCADIGIVLLREEGHIRGAEEPPAEGSLLCPPWLDMNILK